MSRQRNLSDLLDSNGDVKSSALDNVPASNNASALTTGTLPDARLSNQVRVIKSSSAPGSPQEGDLWYDTSEEELKVYEKYGDIEYNDIKVWSESPETISKFKDKYGLDWRVKLDENVAKMMEKISPLHEKIAGLEKKAKASGISYSI